MKPSMRSRLEQLAHRLIEVDALLAEPETAADMDRFRKLSRERAELEPVVEAFNAFLGVEADVATAQEMLSDPDMKAMAEDEIKTGRARIEEMEAALQLLLLPRDPDDGRSLFLEIRAGTAATKARCSPATCCACIRATRKRGVGAWRSCRRASRSWAATRK